MKSRKSALQHLIDVNCVGGMDRSTPLSVDARFSYKELVNVFLDIGSDANKADKYGRTPLH